MSIIDYSWDFSKEEFNLDLDFFNEKDQEDKLWQARTGLNCETLCGAIETIIFMSDKPVPLVKIKNQIDSDLPLRVIHESIARLQTEYEEKHHGIRLMEVAQGYQFRTKATYSKIVQSMYKVQALQLSPTALEVLAMVAYKQPISKNQIENIRGVDSSHVVRALMDRRLVKIVGRSDEPGRPSLYGTSHEFLEIFNLNTIDDLPSEIELEEIANANEVGKISDIKNIVQISDKKRFDMDELVELDELSKNIKDIASETLFTKSLKEMDKVRKSEEGIEKKSAFDILEEYVSKAQIIEQNKNSIISEVITSVMEPRPVSMKDLMEQILNAPESELDDVEEETASMDLTSIQDDNGKLNVSSSDFEELDSSEAREIETKADDILEKSNELLSSLSNEAELEEELDQAFGQLMGISEQVEEVSLANDKSDEMDLSSFISSKIASAQVENIDEVKEMLAEAKEDLGEEVIEDIVTEAKTEAQELAQALDEAFDRLTFGVQEDISSGNHQHSEQTNSDSNHLQ